jgi:hypothetical protein
VVGVEAYAERNAVAEDRFRRLSALLARRAAALAHPAACGSYSTRTVRLSEQNRAEMDETLAGAVLCGLHPCGDLSPVLLRAFLESRAAAVAFVGCCYHALSTDGVDPGFPLSATARTLGVRASPAHRELACHAAEAWAQKAPCARRIHAHRALLEVFLQRCWPGCSLGSRIGRMRLRADTEGDDVTAFVSYARQVLSRLAVPAAESTGTVCHGVDKHKRKAGAEDEHTVGENALCGCGEAAHGTEPGPAPAADASKQPPPVLKQESAPTSALPVAAVAAAATAAAALPTDTELAEAVSRAGPSTAIACLFALRLLCAHLIETLVIADRVAFLDESLGPDATVEAHVVFEPEVSPRNVLIIARRGRE